MLCEADVFLGSRQIGYNQSLSDVGHRRRNRRGNGGARPRNAETARGRKYLSIICQVYLMVDSQSSISLSLFI